MVFLDLRSKFTKCLENGEMGMCGYFWNSPLQYCCHFSFSRFIIANAFVLFFEQLTYFMILVICLLKTRIFTEERKSCPLLSYSYCLYQPDLHPYLFSKSLYHMPVSNEVIGLQEWRSLYYDTDRLMRTTPTNCRTHLGVSK